MLEINTSRRLSPVSAVGPVDSHALHLTPYTNLRPLEIFHDVYQVSNSFLRPNEPLPIPKKTLVLRLTCVTPVLEQAPKSRYNRLLLYMLCIHVPNRYLISWEIRDSY